MKKTIAVLAYPGGNNASVKNAVSYCVPNAHIITTNQQNILTEADYIIFPGQGTMQAATDTLHQQKLHESIKKMIEQDQPFLGICIGLHVLMARSEETHTHPALEVFDGHVQKIPLDQSIRVPHMGWNPVHQTQNHPIWQDIPNDSCFYYAHSYHVTKHNQHNVIGQTTYGDMWPAVMVHQKTVGCQFHPEKSHHHGLQFLQNFFNL